MNWKIPAALVAVAAAIAVVVLATGDDGDSDQATMSAKQTDGAFIAEMIPHHESAIEMARIAQAKAEHPQIKQLAGAIISAQQNEITRLEKANRRLFGMAVSEGPGGTLGMDQSQMGMNMDPAELRSARPFDRMFIDMMVRHHQAAIEMARIELAKGQDPELQRIATAIVDAQAREIGQMNTWRRSWYGAPSPSGGVPPEGESTGSSTMESTETMEGM